MHAADASKHHSNDDDGNGTQAGTGRLLFPTEDEVLRMWRQTINEEDDGRAQSSPSPFGRIRELDADTKRIIWGRLATERGIDLAEWEHVFAD